MPIKILNGLSTSSAKRLSDFVDSIRYESPRFACHKISIKDTPSCLHYQVPFGEYMLDNEEFMEEFQRRMPYAFSEFQKEIQNKKNKVARDKEEDRLFKERKSEQKKEQERRRAEKIARNEELDRKAEELSRKELDRKERKKAKLAKIRTNFECLELEQNKTDHFFVDIEHVELDEQETLEQRDFWLYGNRNMSESGFRGVKPECFRDDIWNDIFLSQDSDFDSHMIEFRNHMKLMDEEPEYTERHEMNVLFFVFNRKTSNHWHERSIRKLNR